LQVEVLVKLHLQVEVLVQLQNLCDHWCWCREFQSDIPVSLCFLWCKKSAGESA